mmetsp:Transcript_12168/g.25530  ORF Transcript_12168/g.25530 Transcript_12168/m.25530 type:complete len:213 (-) Transcript_12168:1519-2157(-)
MEEAAMSDTATTASYFSKEEYARYVALIDEYFSEDCIAIMEAALEARFAKLVLDHPDLYSGEGPPRLVRRLRHNDPYLPEGMTTLFVGGYGVIRNDQDMPDTLAMATFDEKTGTWRYIQGCIRALYDTVFPGLMHVDKGVVQKKVGMMDLIPLVVHQQTATKLKKGDQVGGNDLVLEHLKCKGLFEVLQVSIKIYTRASTHTHPTPYRFALR